MSKIYQEKLLDFNKSGEMIESSTIINSKAALKFIKKLQENKAMGGNWKLDIFIDECVESLYWTYICLCCLFKG